MQYMDMDIVRYREEIQMDQARWGSVVSVAGRVLLWMDLILLSFFYSSIRDGSYFWVYWVIAEAILGGAMTIGGNWYRYHVVKSQQ
jgi:hypothetical protein